MFHRNERIELHIFKMLNDHNNIHLEVLKLIVNENTPTALLVTYLKIKYNIIGDIILKNCPKKHLYSEIRNKI